MSEPFYDREYITTCLSEAKAELLDEHDRKFWRGVPRDLLELLLGRMKHITLNRLTEPAAPKGPDHDDR